MAEPTQTQTNAANTSNQSQSAAANAQLSQTVDPKATITPTVTQYQGEGGCVQLVGGPVAPVDPKVSIRPTLVQRDHTPKGRK